MVDSVPFGQVCRLFERVEATKGSSRKQDLFASFFKSVPALLTENAFPLLRLLVPKFDREKTYGISAKKIAAIYIQANSWPPHGEKASRLTQWADKKQGNKSEGVSNFTNVLEGILKEEGLTVDSGWTVAQINSLLAELNELTNIADRISLWRRLALELTSATQHKWLMRIILKDLKLGIGETTILSVFHPSALEWYNNTSDLQLVCSNVIETGESQPHRSSVTAISPENPIRPMLAARAVWSDIEERITNGRWAVELKFDGERCLIHKSNGVFRLFSRNQLELSTRYPDYLTSMETLFQTHIMASSCIIDGEILAWDESRAGFASFGTNRSVASGLVENCSLAYMAFDIVYMNGKVLVDLPLEERQKVLSACIPNGIPNRFEVAKKEVITSAEQVITALDCAIEQSNEGLILKNLDSVYSVNARDKDSWMKIKADYLLNDSMCDTMDLIILGAYLGKRGGGGYTSFLLGLANGQNRDGEGYPKTFFTFSKVGSGFTQDELALLLERIEPYFEKFDKAAIPSWFEPLSPQFPAPDAIIDPKFSAVLEIKGFEISAGSRHSSGYNIRFPTTIRVRNDKFWHECWTVDDVAEIVRSSSGGRLCHSVRESLFARAHSPRRVRKVRAVECLLSANTI
uniref:DNA ligase n=1 Tax=Spongospora subterranea TaxID=70186 RepID=A0A0H5QL44_9EUKA|eukprot:CRZ02738.1 hypothetical protein [Spongospora subterranea]